MLAIFIKNMTDVIKNSVKNSDANKDAKFLNK
jgi:hypothetical protein